ncbi:MAG: energy-coupling factor transporter transmembrane component T family protein [Oscillospiraceae bacterium]|jgi:energy-coupling factor transport system permease protein
MALTDISIGQYFPGNSPVHRMDPRMKLVLTFVYVIMLFLAGNFLSLAMGVILLLVVYPISRVPLKLIVKSVKPIVPIVLFTGILNMFFVKGDPLWTLGFLVISRQGLRMAALLALRILCLIAGTSLLTYTTSPIALTDGIEQLFSPLKKLGAPVHEIAMMMTITLRFIPTLIEETDKIMSAQKARGADLESGGLFQRIRALLPILIPLFVSAFRRAEELALAMECRCYHGGEGRTRMRTLQLGRVDTLAALLVGVFLAATIFFSSVGAG